MEFGFLDEAGDVAYSQGATSHFIVAVVVVGHPERLRKAVVRTRRTFGRQLKGASELKASHNVPRITERLLQHAARIGFESVAVVADKRLFSPPSDPEDLYRTACARAAREALQHFGALSLTLDRRYTSLKLQRRLDEALVASMADLEGVTLAIHYEVSEKERVLQVADALAWSLFQKYERHDETFWQLIQEHAREVKLEGT